MTAAELFYLVTKGKGVSDRGKKYEGYSRNKYCKKHDVSKCVH